MQERRSKPRRKGDAMSNEEIMKAIKELADCLDEHMTKYERDMRGDMNLGNGEKGLVGEIRSIKEYIRDYPTIAWQFKKSPVKVIGSIVGIFMVLMMLYTAGLLELFAKMAGVSFP